MQRIDIFVLFVILTVAGGLAYSPDAPNLHLLAVTSGHFGTAPTGPAGTALPSAHLSGQLVLRAIADHVGATTSILVRSDERRYVSRDDVFNSLERIKELVNGTTGSDVVIVYMMGHGYGEGFAWHYFLQPGNIGLSNIATSIDINRIGVETLASKLISVGEVVDALKAMDTRYVLLVDACYEGESVQVESPLFSDEFKRNVTDIQSVILFMNQFRDPDPVVFSTSPGSVVRTVQIPDATGILAKQKIGPLARRILLFLNRWDTGRTLTERLLVEALVSLDLDPVTKPAICFAEFGAPFLIVGQKPADDIRVVWGTGRAEHFYELVPDASDDEMNALAPQDQVRSAFLALDGGADEWVSGGRSYRLESDDSRVVIHNWEPGDLSLTFYTDNGDWSVSVAVPKGEMFERNRYGDVVRYPFQNGAEAALEVTGPGRGCNEVAGAFTVQTVEYAGDDLVALKIRFSQVCDGGGSALTGSLAAER